MRNPVFVAAALLVLAGGAGSSQRLAWSFEESVAGRAPQGFLFAAGQPGRSAGSWQVLRDGGNAVLAHAPDGRGGVALAIASGTSLAFEPVRARASPNANCT